MAETQWLMTNFGGHGSCRAKNSLSGRAGARPSKKNLPTEVGTKFFASSTTG